MRHRLRVLVPGSPVQLAAGAVLTDAAHGRPRPFRCGCTAANNGNPDGIASIDRHQIIGGATVVWDIWNYRTPFAPLLMQVRDACRLALVADRSEPVGVRGPRARAGLAAGD
ncbi:hypothetical protein A5656_28400 [Mycobacterium gordonae]|nr:hypothetical protein A5656_28400 [Mycobacterium gordonae]